MNCTFSLQLARRSFLLVVVLGNLLLFLGPVVNPFESEAKVSQSHEVPKAELSKGAQQAPPKSSAVPTQNLTNFMAESTVSTSDAFCRCSQMGDDQPPAGLKNVAGVELNKLLQEMQRELRMFIYPLNIRCKTALRRLRGIGGNRGYMVEWNFYDRAMSSIMRVLDPEKATIFYIPTFTKCWREQVKHIKNYSRVREMVSFRMGQMLQDLSKFPFLERHSGRKHFWVSVHDMGKNEPLWWWCNQTNQCNQSFLDLAEMVAQNATAMVNSADPTFGFSPRDVSLVCNGDVHLAARSHSVKAHRARHHSVFFAGKWGPEYPVPVRRIAISSIQQAELPKPPYFTSGMPREAYEKALQDSDLCLALKGQATWSPRLFEMIWFGCIPVIISSGYHLPGSCFFDWRDFAIFIEDSDAHQAGQILKAYLDDPKRLEILRAKVFEVRRAFMWHDEQKTGDAFELAMLDVYLKQQRHCG